MANAVVVLPDDVVITMPAPCVDADTYAGSRRTLEAEREGSFSTTETDPGRDVLFTVGTADDRVVPPAEQLARAPTSAAASTTLRTSRISEKWIR
jgi:hypothetical protein